MALIARCQGGPKLETKTWSSLKVILYLSALKTHIRIFEPLVTTVDCRWNNFRIIYIRIMSNYLYVYVPCRFSSYYLSRSEVSCVKFYGYALRFYLFIFLGFFMTHHHKIYYTQISLVTGHWSVVAHISKIEYNGLVAHFLVCVNEVQMNGKEENNRWCNVLVNRLRFWVHEWL